MNDYSPTVRLLIQNYLSFKDRASNDPDKNFKMFYTNLVATREQLIIDLANKIIKENEKRYGII